MRYTLIDVVDFNYFIPEAYGLGLRNASDTEFVTVEGSKATATHERFLKFMNDDLRPGLCQFK